MGHYEKTTNFIGIITPNNQPMKHDHSKTLSPMIRAVHHCRVETL